MTAQSFGTYQLNKVIEKENAVNDLLATLASHAT